MTEDTIVGFRISHSDEKKDAHEKSEARVGVGHCSKRRMNWRMQICVEARSLPHTPENNQHDVRVIGDHSSQPIIPVYRMRETDS